MKFGVTFSIEKGPIQVSDVTVGRFQGPENDVRDDASVLSLAETQTPVLPWRLKTKTTRKLMSRREMNHFK